MKNYYDIAIIGGGIGGLMAAYRITERDPSASVCIIEKGHTIEKRSCPIVTKKVDKCIKCPSCAIMEGLAGAGAFSDGKYVISTEYGGWLTDFLAPSTVIDYIEQADKILVSFGATTERFMPNNDLKKLCLQNDLHMAQAQLKHLGTDANFDTMRKLIEEISSKVEIVTDTNVIDVNRESHEIFTEDRSGTASFKADEIIFAVGRAGSRFFSEWCAQNQIPLENNQVDVGVRVELPSMIWDDFSKKIYEPKIWYRSKKYGDVTRMFCFNERGQVVTENTDGVLTVNGHAYRDEAKKSQNSNFALLSTIRFTQPFNQPIEYARHVAGWPTSSAAAACWCSAWAIWRTAAAPMRPGCASPPPAPPWTRWPAISPCACPSASSTAFWRPCTPWTPLPPAPPTTTPCSTALSANTTPPARQPTTLPSVDARASTPWATGPASPVPSPRRRPTAFTWPTS